MALMVSAPDPWWSAEHRTDVERRDERHGWALVDAAQAGDSVAFGAIYREHFPAVLAVLVARTHDRFRAEEFANETFLRAFRQIGTLTYQGRSIRAWLMTIAKNLLRDEVRSARYRHEVLAMVPHEYPSEDLDPQSIVCSQVLLTQVIQAMRVLTADQRWCIALRFFDGFSAVETAELMGRTPEAVRALQLRAVRRLSIELLPYLHEECA